MPKYTFSILYRAPDGMIRLISLTDIAQAMADELTELTDLGAIILSITIVPHTSSNV